MTKTALRLKAARKARGLTQGELARLSGCSPSTVSRFERDYFPFPETNKIIHMAEQMRVDALWLLGQPGNPSRSDGDNALIRYFLQHP